MRSLSPGTLIDRYELVSPIGEGGMAEVWVARQKGKHGFEKLFAFKCIHHRFAEVDAFRSMFLDEARIAAAIEHPNVAQVFDLGEAESMLYLVIEYVDGESLGALMNAAAKRAGAAVAVPVPVALRIIADACAGLDAAHRLKDAAGNALHVVHRDVSPQNILVSVRGDVKVIDFGIAHARDRIGGDTGEGSLKGKIHYMAPEQALRKDLGPFTDVFGIGATLYRMLSGLPPYDGGNDAATLHLLLSGGPPPPLPDNVPPLVAAIIERALSHDPGDRYVSALEMQTALEQAIAEEGYVPDVATWVKENISENAQARRAQLHSTRTINIRPSELIDMNVPTFDAELGSAPARMPSPPSEAPSEAPPIELASAAPHAFGGGPPGALAPNQASSERPRSMMDVYALVSRGSAAPRAEYASAPRVAAVAPPMPDTPAYAPPPPPYAPPPSASLLDHQQSDLRAPESFREPVQAREVNYVGPATSAKPVVDNARAIKIGIAVTALAVIVAGVLLLLPRLVGDRIIAGARDAGVTLTFERISLGFGNIALHNVTAKPSRVPGAVLKADEVFVVGFSAKEVRVRGADFTIDGTLGDVGPAIIALYDDNRARIAGTPAEPRKINIVSAHLSWTGIWGESSKLDANELAIELDSHGLGMSDIRSGVGSFTVQTKHTTFGPWAGTYDRTVASGGSSRVRLLFDPPVQDGPSALIFWTNTASPHLTINVARSQVSHLGLRLADFGYPDSTNAELSAKLEYGLSPTMHDEGSGRVDLYALKVKGLRAPIDVSAVGNVWGNPGRPMDFEKTTVTVGPFVTTITGTIAPTDFGFRMDASWRALPIGCDKLARAEARSIGPLAAALADLAHSSGVARVTGTANASGVVKYDTKVPDEVSSTVLAHDTCGLAIFGF